MPNTISPNMNLILPTVGQELGPTWATDLNSSLSLVDQHNHASGNGVQVTPSGLNISSDLTIQGNNLTNIRSVRFAAQISPISNVTDVGCLYEAGVDLYYNDASGNQIRLTQSGHISGGPGSITGLLAPASVTYVSATPVFIFQSNTNTSAGIDGGPLTIRQVLNGANGITLQSPNSLAASYSLTLPTALPSSTGILQVDSSGNISVDTSSGLLPSGSVIPYAGSSAPTGYLLCDGSSYSSTTYAALFAVIGYTYGGSFGTFQVPDLRGRMALGAGQGSGLTNRVLGDDGGDENLQTHDHTGTTGNESTTHNHTVPIVTGQNGAGSSSGSNPLGTSSTSGLTTLNTGVESVVHNHAFTTNNAGSGSGGNMSPFLVLTYIIKY